MKLSTILFLLPFASCAQSFSNQEVLGTYVPAGYKNNFDTVQLLNDGQFKRKIYDQNKKLVLENKGTWVIASNSKIKFKKFYLNLDEDFTLIQESNKKLIDGYGDVEVVLETHNDTIQFCVGYYQGENCYQKIK